MPPMELRGKPILLKPPGEEFWCLGDRDTIGGLAEIGRTCM